MAMHSEAADVQARNESNDTPQHCQRPSHCNRAHGTRAPSGRRKPSRGRSSSVSLPSHATLNGSASCGTRTGRGPRAGVEMAPPPMLTCCCRRRSRATIAAVQGFHAHDWPSTKSAAPSPACRHTCVQDAAGHPGRRRRLGALPLQHLWPGQELRRGRALQHGRDGAPRGPCSSMGGGIPDPSAGRCACLLALRPALPAPRLRPAAWRPQWRAGASCLARSRTRA